MMRDEGKTKSGDKQREDQPLKKVNEDENSETAQFRDTDEMRRTQKQPGQDITDPTPETSGQASVPDKANSRRSGSIAGDKGG